VCSSDLEQFEDLVAVGTAHGVDRQRHSRQVSLQVGRGQFLEAVADDKYARARRRSGQRQHRHHSRHNRELARSRHRANFYTSQMRPSPVVIVGILLGLALVLPGCGDQSAPAAGTGAVTPHGVEAGASPATSTCRTQLHGLLGSMDDLRGKLAVGLSYGAYLHEVKAAQGTYDRVPVDRLQLGCLVKVGTPAERALNLYLDAANTWGECLTNASCDSESVEPKLQRSWALASDRLSLAQKGLRPRSRD